MLASQPASQPARPAAPTTTPAPPNRSLNLSILYHPHPSIHPTKTKHPPKKKTKKLPNSTYSNLPTFRPPYSRQQNHPREKGTEYPAAAPKISPSLFSLGLSWLCFVLLAAINGKGFGVRMHVCHVRGWLVGGGEWW
jgi:hypothetical protein